MTRTRLLFSAVAAVVLAACGSRTEGLDRTKVPDDLKGDYDLFARKCSKCHSLARPLQSGISDDEQWILYVNRMRRQPGSGINYEDQEHILRFLRYFAAELRAKQGKGGPPDAAAPAPSSSSPSSSPSQAPVVDDPKDGGR
jgi:hypothetical protein